MKIRLLLTAAFPLMAGAQSFVPFSQPGDTVTNNTLAASGTLIDVQNPLKGYENPSVIKWQAVSYSAPAGWRLLDFADNRNCYSNDSVSAPPHGQIFNGQQFISAPYEMAVYGVFEARFDPTAATNGTCAWVCIKATDTATAYTRYLTYRTCKSATGVLTTMALHEEMILFPNPAEAVLNVSMPHAARPASYFILDAAGRLIQQGPLTASATELNINEIRSGQYWLSVTDADHHIIGTRQFGRQ